MKPFTSLLVLSLLLSSFCTSPSFCSAFYEMLTLNDGKLSAHITTMPLSQVLEQFSEISGVPVRWLNGEISSETVTVEFTQLPLSQGLRKILAKQDFMLFYSSSSPHSQLTHIWITNRGDGQSLLASSRAKLSEPTASVNGTDREGDEALTRMQPEQLTYIALQDNDPMLREKAVGYLEASAHKDRRAFDALTRLAQQAPHTEVQELAAEALQQFE